MPAAESPAAGFTRAARPPADNPARRTTSRNHDDALTHHARPGLPVRPCGTIVTRVLARNTRGCRGCCYDGKDLGTAWRHGSASPRTDGKAQRAAIDTDGIWLTQRDIDGLVLCGEHYAAPYDLLAAALGIGSQATMYRLMMRWRDTGYAATGQLGAGPSWCWLTRKGMAATGLGFPATRPALTRLAHIRAVLAARLWLEARPAWTQGQAWWHSERRLKAAQLPPGYRGAGARAGRGDPLAQPRRQSPRRAGVGHRGRADAQAARADQPDHGRAADPAAVRPGGVPDRARRRTGGDPRRGHASGPMAGPDHRPEPAQVRAHLAAVWR